ncbi:MAG: hypothetical protein PF637_01315 [Spirochaetes bacterium]|jgi:hypothetical protein|nr:hypothetical protein [Spirochaetota bacterium]
MKRICNVTFLLMIPLLLHITCVNDEQSYLDCLQECSAELSHCTDGCNELTELDGRSSCMDRCDDYHEKCRNRCD